VIVGGGVSGLAAAYLLQERDILLLEKEPHWGGNAYLMEYEGASYATGAAFTWSGDEAFPFYKELGLEPLAINCWDGSILKGEFVPDTWGEGIDRLPYSPSVREAFKRFKHEMLAIDVKQRYTELFNVPFSNFLRGYPAEIKQWWDAYGPSNWGATSEDTAAVLAIEELRSFAGDKRQDARYTWPGGNGAITRRLSEILQPKFGDHMQTGATTVAVVPQKSEVQVSYMQGGNLKTVAARAVVMATPKFITHHIVDSLPEKQRDAMKKIRYIPYPVVNLVFDKPVFNKGYDTWCPGNKFTDFIVADWVVRNQPGYLQKHNILTFYTPLSEDDRGYLLNEIGSRKIAETVLHDFQKLFPGSDVDPVEVHIYRRGHPLYMSTPRLFTEVQPLARQPMDRVFFANTDSQGPESTTSSAIAAARRAVKEVEHRLAGKPGTPQQSAVVFGG
jgi:monoamine oxidase